VKSSVNKGALGTLDPEPEPESESELDDEEDEDGPASAAAFALLVPSWPIASRLSDSCGA
jgi:hypothetical protein